MCFHENWSLSVQETLQISSSFLLIILANVMGCDRGDDRGWVHNTDTQAILHRVYTVYTIQCTNRGWMRVNWS